MCTGVVVSSEFFLFCFNAWLVLESLHFTFYSQCCVSLSSPSVFFTISPFCPHLPLPLRQQNLHRPSFHSNRLPWKLGDSAVHPILLLLGEVFGKFVLTWFKCLNMHEYCTFCKLEYVYCRYCMHAV